MCDTCVSSLVRQKEKLACGETDGYARVKQFVLSDLGGFFVGLSVVVVLSFFNFVLFETNRVLLYSSGRPRTIRPIWLQTHRNAPAFIS